MLCGRCVRRRLCDAASFSISACSFSVTLVPADRVRSSDLVVIPYSGLDDGALRVKRFGEFTRVDVRDGRLAKNKRGCSRIPMKLSLDALGKRQRLWIRVPASPLSFVNALQAGSFGIWVHFKKVRRQPFSYRLGKDCSSSANCGVRGQEPLIARTVEEHALSEACSNG